MSKIIGSNAAKVLAQWALGDPGWADHIIEALACKTEDDAFRLLAQFDCDEDDAREVMDEIDSDDDPDVIGTVDPASGFRPIDSTTGRIA